MLRQAWRAGRAKRVLILAPKAVLKQWQVELREKFNLNWPIYDGRKLVWYPSPAWRGHNERSTRSYPSLETMTGNLASLRLIGGGQCRRAACC